MRERGERSSRIPKPRRGDTTRGVFPRGDVDVSAPNFRVPAKKSFSVYAPYARERKKKIPPRIINWLIFVMIMNIIKRDGTREDYDATKISRAIRAAFDGLGTQCDAADLSAMVGRIEALLRTLCETSASGVKVEQVQDIVEIEMMKSGFFREARRFILYREERSKERAILEEIRAAVPVPGLRRLLKDARRAFPQSAYSPELLAAKLRAFRKEGMSPGDALRSLIRAAVECVSAEAPDWEFIAARILGFQHALSVREQTDSLKLSGFYEKISYLVSEGLYGQYILDNYSEDDVQALEAYLKPERDALFTFSGLDLLLKRYVINDHRRRPIETPQEMFMGIAMHLAIPEKPADRVRIAKTFYDMLSRQQVTMATPTISNARKPYFQLSSCFVDTVLDSLDGIYRSISNFSQVSKFGGGMGLYFGKVRASGSDIRGYKGAAGGVIRWIKLANDTAVAVDQLGVRSGAVAVYLDVWHRDILDFLQLRTNNGDDRMKAHDVFPAVCYPDLFWKMVKEDMNQTWHLMCPHEILVTKGYALEDFYGEEWEKRYLDCIHDARIRKTEIQLKDLVRLILKSAVETGTPFAFNRDLVNRANPNRHKGIIYCSNLCTEIAQNMSAIETVSRTTELVDGECVVVEKTRPGDFVVCNLASLVLGRLDFSDDAEIRRVVSTLVRALDNVIDLNYYPLQYAEITNKRYRPIGLGASGYHHLLAKNGIAWETEEHLKFIDSVFEKINFFAVEASANLAKEKGAYAEFSGSDWESGEYFRSRGYTDEKWSELAEKVRRDGMRNGYLMAIAPTSSTSILAGTTAGTDPVMSRFFLEEKKGSTIARVAPELSPGTWWLYKSAHLTEQTWSVRAAGVRQRHVDQAQSVNLYITNEYSFRKVLDLYLLAWECGVKTIYYVRSKSLEVEECESCAS